MRARRDVPILGVRQCVRTPAVTARQSRSRPPYASRTAAIGTLRGASRRAQRTTRTRKVAEPAGSDWYKNRDAVPLRRRRVGERLRCAQLAAAAAASSSCGTRCGGRSRDSKLFPRDRKMLNCLRSRGRPPDCGPQLRRRWRCRGGAQRSRASAAAPCRLRAAHWR